METREEIDYEVGLTIGERYDYLMKHTFSGRWCRLVDRLPIPHMFKLFMWHWF